MIKSKIQRSFKNTGPKDFELETTSMWSFPKRGNWSSHNGRYRGNWSPYIPRNIILRYSKRNDLVLDQFVGSGTTMIESVLLNRKGIGIDININSLKISKNNIMKIKSNNESFPKLYKYDSSNLDFIKDKSIDLICTHPPYGDIIKYGDNISGDLSNLSIDKFLSQMELVAKESFRILKHEKYCAIMMGDIRKNRNIIPLGFETMNRFMEAGFKLKEIIIKEQHNCKGTEYWIDKSIKYNFLLIVHEYLFIFYKD